MTRHSVSEASAATAALLRSFLPPRLSGVPAPVERTSGAVAFADLAGFTALGVELSRQHGAKGGAEELTEVVDWLYSRLFAPVGVHDGIVAAFIGDAVLCIFPGAPKEASERARRCSLEMIAAVRDSVRPNVPPLSLRVAVAGGDVIRFIAGDPRIRLFDIYAGSAITRVSALAPLVPRGDVLVDESAGDDVVTADSPGLPEAAALPDSAQWMPARFHARMLRGEGRLATDLRPVSPIFLGFQGIDFAAPDAYERLNTWIRHVQGTMESFGGTVVDVTVTDKGPIVYAAIGAIETYEDTPQRAVRAVQELLTSIPGGLVEQVRASITFGQARVGPIGAEMRRAWAVLGSPVNLAARLLEHAAPGSCLISDDVARSIGDRFQLEAAGAVPVKGFAEPVVLHRVSGKRSPPSDSVQSTGFVGRGDVIDSVESTLRELLRRGQSEVMVIDGVAGIGKSALMQEIRSRASARGLRTVASAGDAIERTTPHHVWRPILAALGDLEERIRAIDPALVELLPLLAPLGFNQWPETPRTRDLSGSNRADLLQDLLVRLIAGTDDEPSRVLLIDDAHWMDSASWNLARAVLSRAHRMLMILSQRPWTDAPPAEPAALIALATRHLHLAPLQVRDIEVLIGAHVGVSMVAPDVTGTITKAAGGHPLFARSLALALLEQGVLCVAKDRLSFAAGLSTTALRELPESVEQVIASRIDRLDPSIVFTLRLASVLGNAFTQRALESVHPPGMDSSGVAEHLRSLAAAGLMRQAESGEYRFDHAVARDVVYLRIPQAMRRELHAAAAAWIEAEAAQTGALPWSTLAHHWQGAGDLNRSIQALDRAGEHAFLAGAFREAAEHLEGARKLDPDWSDQQAKRLELLSWTYHRLGKDDEALACAEACIARLDRPPPGNARGVLTATLLESLRQFLHRLALRLSLGRPERRKLYQAAAGQYQTYSEIAYALNQPGKLTYATVRQLNVAERGGPSERLVEAYGTTSIITGMFGLPGLARRYSVLAQRTLNSITASPGIQALCTHQRNMLGLMLGEFVPVLQTQPEAIAVFDRQADRGRMRDGRIILGNAQFYAADWEGCRVTLEAARTPAAGEGHFSQQLLATLLLASIECHRGRWSEARREIDFMVRIARQCSPELAEGALRALCAREALARGDTIEARQHVQGALDKLAKTRNVPLGPPDVEASMGASQVSITLWEDALARGRGADAQDIAQLVRRAEAALKMGRRFMKCLEPAFHLHRARVARIRGRVTQALAEADTGLIAARRMSMRWEEAQLISHRIALASAGEQDQEVLSGIQQALHLPGRAAPLALPAAGEDP